MEIIRGEFWIESGFVKFADGEVGDENHESIAINELVNEFAPAIIEFAEQVANEQDQKPHPDWGEGYYFKKTLAKLQQQARREEIDPSVVSDILSSINEYVSESRTIKSIGITPEAFQILNGHGNASEYMMKYKGWIAVRSMNIELYGYNEQKRKYLLNGLNEIFVDEGFDDELNPEEIEFTMYDHKTGRANELTLADIERPMVAFRPQQMPTTQGHSKFAVIPDNDEKQTTKSIPNRYNVAAQQTGMIGPGQQLWRGTSESVSFARFVEISDIQDRDLSNIQLQDNGDSSIYKFQVNGNQFEVEMALVSDVLSDGKLGNVLNDCGIEWEDIENKYLSDIYEIALIGPRGTRLTNNIDGAMEIYAQMLLAIRKLTQTKNVNGLKFSAAHKFMTSVYNRFIEKFTDLKIVDSENGIYLKKNIIEEIIQKTQKCNGFIQFLQANQEEHKGNLKQALGMKSIHRRMNRDNLDKTILGKIVSLKNYPRTGIVFGVDDKWLEMAFVDNKNELQIFPNYYITDIQRTPPNMMVDAQKLIYIIQNANFSNPQQKMVLNKIKSIPGYGEVYRGWLPSDEEAFK